MDTLESRMERYRDERDQLRVEISEMIKRLKERNDDVNHIEQKVNFLMAKGQVLSVKSTMESKYEQKVKELENIIQAKETVIDQVHQTLKVKGKWLKCKAQNLKFSSWDKEREGLIQTVKRLQKQLSELVSEVMMRVINILQKERRESDFKSLIESLEKENEQLKGKMCKLKSAFMDG